MRRLVVAVVAMLLLWSCAKGSSSTDGSARASTTTTISPALSLKPAEQSWCQANLQAVAAAAVKLQLPAAASVDAKDFTSGGADVDVAAMRNAFSGANGRGLYPQYPPPSDDELVKRSPWRWYGLEDLTTACRAAYVDR